MNVIKLGSKGDQHSLAASHTITIKMSSDAEEYGNVCTVQVLLMENKKILTLVMQLINLCYFKTYMFLIISLQTFE